MSISQGGSKPKKLLIITSSGGGGLLQAAYAKEQEARLQDPHLLIVRRDVIQDWVGRGFGKFCLSIWNGAQRKGNVKAQKFFIWCQFLFDYLSWPNIFFRTLYLLFVENIDRIVDTQPMGTSAILKALRIFNRRKNKNVCLEKVVVDLPTKKATHYFRSIKALSKNDKRYLRLTTIRPLLGEGETAEEFWQENCGLSDREIQYEEPYVRLAFRKYRGKERSGDAIAIPIRFQQRDELALMRRAFEKGSIPFEVKGREVVFSIAPGDRLITVLLSSQPAQEATLHYVKQVIHLARELDKESAPIHLFVFCGDRVEKEQTLFRKVSDCVAKTRGYPQLLSVIPFCFQSDEVIAPLFYRSDLTCTRSGGQTAMELICVNAGEIWIHSEAKKEEGELLPEELLQGIPGWEAANAVYLQKVRGAKIITPETFLLEGRRFLQSSAGRDFPMRALGCRE